MGTAINPAIASGAKGASRSPRASMPRLARCPACDATTENARSVAYRLTGDEHLWDPDHCFRENPVLICGNCQLGFTGNEMADAELDRFYGNVYSRRLGLPAKPTPFPEFNARFLSQSLFLKSFFDLRDGMRVLEIGSSEVGVLPTLSLFCRPRYFYFDQTDSPVIQSFGGERLGTFATCDSIAKSVPEKSLDLVYMSHSLEHLNPVQLRDMITTIARSLKSGGVFFFEVPNEVHPDLAKARLYPPHTLFFSEKSIRLLLRSCGLDVEVLSVLGLEHLTKPEPTSTPAAQRASVEPVPLTEKIKNSLLRNPLAFKVLRPLLWRRFFTGALRRLRTPYEHESFFRVIARNP